MKEIRKIMQHLEEKYEERGKDFYFKSKQLSKNLDISKYIIGRAIIQEANKPNSKIVIVKSCGHGSSLFKTEFEEEPCSITI